MNTRVSQPQAENCEHSSLQLREEATKEQAQCSRSVSRPWPCRQRAVLGSQACLQWALSSLLLDEVTGTRPAQL